MDETLIALPVVRIALGAALLLLGRRLYWLFVAAAGFMVGWVLANQFAPEQAETVRVGIGLVCGLLGAVLAGIFQRGVVSLAGFLIGAISTSVLLQLIQIDVGNYAWLVVLIAGLASIVLVQVVFDWALIVLSVYAGASLLVSGAQPMLNLDATLSTVAFIALLLAGIAIQAGSRRP